MLVVAISSCNTAQRLSVAAECASLIGETCHARRESRTLAADPWDCWRRSLLTTDRLCRAARSRTWRQLSEALPCAAWSVLVLDVLRGVALQIAMPRVHEGCSDFAVSCAVFSPPPLVSTASLANANESCKPVRKHVLAALSPEWLAPRRTFHFSFT